MFWLVFFTGFPNPPIVIWLIGLNSTDRLMLFKGRGVKLGIETTDPSADLTDEMNGALDDPTVAAGFVLLKVAAGFVLKDATGFVLKDATGFVLKDATGFVLKDATGLDLC
jgi:hypothetical protein